MSLFLTEDGTREMCHSSTFPCGTDNLTEQMFQLVEPMWRLITLRDVKDSPRPDNDTELRRQRNQYIHMILDLIENVSLPLPT